MKKEIISIRTNKENPNHHLWVNGGIWWLHFTIHCPDNTKQRIRRSLRTTDICIARRRRDEVLAEYQPPRSSAWMNLEIVFGDTQFCIPVRIVGRAQPRSIAKQAELP
jgi:hypothetical protein